MLARKNFYSIFDNLFGFDSLPFFYGTQSVPTDISTNGEEVVLEMDIPGVDPKDVNISVDGDRLIIKGSRESKETGRSERMKGSFYRAFTIPSTLDSEKISASYDKGVLTLIVPKVPEEKPKQIEVKIK